MSKNIIGFGGVAAIAAGFLMFVVGCGSNSSPAGSSIQCGAGQTLVNGACQTTSALTGNCSSGQIQTAYGCGSQCTAPGGAVGGSVNGSCFAAVAASTVQSGSCAQGQIFTTAGCGSPCSYSAGQVGGFLNGVCNPAVNNGFGQGYQNTCAGGQVMTTAGVCGAACIVTTNGNGTGGMVNGVCTPMSTAVGGYNTGVYGGNGIPSPGIQPGAYPNQTPVMTNVGILYQGPCNPGLLFYQGACYSYTYNTAGGYNYNQRRGGGSGGQLSFYYSVGH